MKLILTACFLFLLLDGCSERTTLSVPAGPLTIRSGTSFGMCVGYCQHDYIFNGTSVTLTQSATRTRAQNPDKTCQSTLSQAEWDALSATANFDAFSKQPPQLGCPDCADGGAEYIELQSGDRRHRVVFEYGKTIPGFETLVDALRTQRSRFMRCE